MRILGVDPGLVTTGYGVIETEGYNGIKFIEAGVIKTNSKENISLRVSDIYNNITNVVTKYKPNFMVLEKLYSHYAHPATSILMGHARGVVCLVCGLNNVRLINYSATHIKKAVTGNGRASKYQIQHMVKSLLRLKSLPNPFDVSDALAMAISYVYMESRPKV